MCVTCVIRPEPFHPRELQANDHDCLAYYSSLFLISRRVSVVKSNFTTVTNPVEPPKVFHTVKAAIQDNWLTCNVDIFAFPRLVSKK